ATGGGLLLRCEHLLAGRAVTVAGALLVVGRRIERGGEAFTAERVRDEEVAVACRHVPLPSTTQGMDPFRHSEGQGIARSRALRKSVIHAACLVATGAQCGGCRTPSRDSTSSCGVSSRRIR